jgi:hypothetical protein
MEVVVKINNDKFREFKNFINKINGEIESLVPEEIIISSVEEVRKSISEAENGDFISEGEEKEIFDKLYKNWSEK